MPKRELLLEKRETSISQLELLNMGFEMVKGEFGEVYFNSNEVSIMVDFDGYVLVTINESEIRYGFDKREIITKEMLRRLFRKHGIRRITKQVPQPMKLGWFQKIIKKIAEKFFQ